jgi:predicted phage-related endonuclease
MKDRFQIIGASEIAGIVKEYSANLFAENLISETISQKLEAMPNYLETRYSLGKKLMLDREQFKRFNDFTNNKAMSRGKEMEEDVKDNYFSLSEWLCEPKITESQTAKDKIIKNCKFPFRATIDYILDDDTILECKTTDISQWFKIENDGLPFNYYIQTQAQLWLHEKEICEVHIAGVKTINKEHQILDSKTFKVGLDPKMVRALTASLIWFSAEFEKGTLFNKDEADKTKKDKQIDEFLALEKGTLELPIESNLSAKLARLKELEEAKKEYEKLDKEIKEQVKQSMKDYKFARFKSNQFEIEAKYSNESYHDETSINEAIEKAKLMTVGDVKSVKKLTIKY